MTPAGRHLIIASFPAALAGVFNLGGQILARPTGVSDDWQQSLLADLGLSAGFPGSLVAGVLYWLPLLVALLLTSFAWSVVFARVRGRPIDPVWVPAAWLLSLMLPATAPVGFAAVALSFGLVFGCHVFGGSRQGMVNPALLAIVFLAISYPTLLDAGAWIPGNETVTTWSLVAGTDAESILTAGSSLTAVFFGDEIGAIGTTSAAACLIGAVYLMAVRLVPFRLVAGAVIALITLGSLHGQPDWPWHLAAGNFAFALAFLAGDPAIRPSSKAGTWAFGALFGALTFFIRTGNPDHPEGSWAALLLAGLCIPLLDYAARAIRRPGTETRNA